MPSTGPLVFLAAAVLAFASAGAKDAEALVRAQMRNQMQAAIKRSGVPLQDGTSVPKALLQAINGKRIVGVGEGTHGTSEVHTFTGNLALEVARERQVLVLWEDAFGSTALINRYVLGGSEEELSLGMAGSFAVHRTKEYEAFFRRVRKHNDSAPPDRKIEIYGVDIWAASAPLDDITPLKEFATKHKLNLGSDLEVCEKAAQQPEAATEEGRAAALAAAMWIKVALSKQDPKTAGVVEAKVMANSLVAATQAEIGLANGFSSVELDQIGSTPASPFVASLRDMGIAENIKTLVDAKLSTGGVALYLAHCGHTAKLNNLQGGVLAKGTSAWGTTGSILSLWLGERYYSLALLTGAGTFRARRLLADGKMTGFEEIQAPSLTEDSLNVIASSVFPSKAVFFDAKGLPCGDVPRPNFMPGAVFFEAKPAQCSVPIVPAWSYDGVVSWPRSRAVIAWK